MSFRLLILDNFPGFLSYYKITTYSKTVFVTLAVDFFKNDALGDDFFFGIINDSIYWHRGYEG
ncbi:MAG TPA: hypothetical protein DCX03_08195 [Bacteroidales bacterium]|nr:hypothetical protein [Bacteroidales bacterium]